MPVYEVSKNGKVYEVDAPDPQSAAKAMERMSAAPAAPAAPTEAPKPDLSTMTWGQMRTAKVSEADAMRELDRRRGVEAQQKAETGVGMLKSLWGTVEGGGKLLRSAFPALNNGPEVQVPFSSTPNTPDEKVGKVVGDIAQFFAPSSLLNKGKAALRTGQGILDAIVGASLEGASAATIQSAQQGSTEGWQRTAGVSAGTGLGLQAALKGAGWLGTRIEHALVKPSTADVKDGFKIANIFRYNLGGSLTQTYDKTQAKLDALTTQLDDVLRRPLPGGQMPQVDVLQAITDTATELQRNAARTFGQNNAIGNAVTKLLDDPIFQQIQGGKVDVATANKIKQAVGELGAWLHDPSGRVMADPDSRAMEVVANALYARLKTAVEQNAQGPIAAINRQLADIIPIKHAIIRRIPVDQRANVLNLGDLVGFSTGAWGLSLANRLLRSGQAANTLVKGGENAATAAGIAAPAAGAGASQVQK